LHRRRQLLRIQERKPRISVAPVAGARTDDRVEQTRATARPLAAIVMSNGDAWLIGIVVICQFGSPSWV
jgi:hypothetical protein